jgi:two-component system LytT family response regulator
MITVMIVDDEPPARERLRSLLTEHADVRVVMEAGSVTEAMRALTGDDVDPPDVMFLDIQMPGGEGFDLVDLLATHRSPAIVFVTAYADHAVRAFDVQAVDYLLKPFSRPRLATTMTKLRRHLEHGLGAPGTGTAGPPRIPYVVGGRVRFMEVAAIETITAERNYVRVRGGGRDALIRSSLIDFEQRLPAGEFLRVNKSAVVRVTRIAEVEPLPHGELLLHLAGGGHLISGRQYSPPLRRALGL